MFMFSPDFSTKTRSAPMPTGAFNLAKLLLFSTASKSNRSHLQVCKNHYTWLWLSCARQQLYFLSYATTAALQVRATHGAQNTERRGVRGGSSKERRKGRQGQLLLSQRCRAAEESLPGGEVTVVTETNQNRKGTCLKKLGVTEQWKPSKSMHTLSVSHTFFSKIWKLNTQTRSQSQARLRRWWC